ncbi:uncharacterized protein LOC120181733 [Hibiscus syriacus]|uniref:uncharacterized protein LOC120181733 n=1 Tax=Hibiscus syriacus TaxID=106335 RepID=UPI001922DFC0|nr:uncharacterized protein LOC120181733 [Hibiscus syriacus]
MGTDRRVEVKPLSGHASFSSPTSSSSSSPRNRNLEHSELVESSTPLNVPPTSSNEQSPEQAPAGCARSRIPSSIFSTQPGTPTEWSIASNESLFSIHVGNNSLSREQFLSLYKSGELTELDEQIIAQGGAMPSLKELEEMAAAEENAGKGCSGSEETPKTVVGTSEVAEDDDDHNKDGNDDSISGLSDESTFSFAFPVLNSTDGGRMSSVNIRQYNQELNIQSAKQPQEKEPEPEPEQCTEEMKPKAPQKGRNQSWFSCFRCCRYP